MSYRREEELVRYLIDCSNPDHPSFVPSALPELRKALLNDKNQYLIYKYLSPFLPEGCGEKKENRIALVATLFAYYNTGKGRGIYTEKGNMGTHLYLSSKKETKAIERRFENLLTCHIDDLPNALFSAISFLKSKEQAVNWEQMRKDIKYWDHPDQFVQKQWARGFWDSQNKEVKNNSQGEKSHDN